MLETTPVTIYHLEMHSVDQFRPSQASNPDFAIQQAKLPSPALNRFLYEAVGSQWLWHERLSWTYLEWMSYLDSPQQETWIGYLAGTPAGYFELERQSEGNTEIAYFGLMPEFIGQGLGGILLTAAVQRAWDAGARRVWVHTCTLDHAAALNNYQARGFRVFKIEQKDIAMPIRNGNGASSLQQAAPIIRQV